MFNNLKTAFAIFLTGAALTNGSLAQSDQGAKQDMKDAAHSTASATKKTGRKVKRGTKRAAHKTAQATRRTADKVEDKTR